MGGFFGGKWGAELIQDNLSCVNDFLFQIGEGTKS